MARRKEPIIPDSILDQLLNGADAKTAFATNGLSDQLKKALAERVLNAEMDHHFSGDEQAGNMRNGYGKKTVITDRGHSSPVASNRFSISLTVVSPIPDRRATSRPLTWASNLSCKISRTRRMATLSVGIIRSCKRRELTTNGRCQPQPTTPRDNVGMGARHNLGMLRAIMSESCARSSRNLHTSASHSKFLC